jgi:hypothetical protein
LRELGVAIVLEARQILQFDENGAGDADSFRASPEKKADSSGKNRLRYGKLSVFPQTVQPSEMQRNRTLRGSAAAIFQADASRLKMKMGTRGSSPIEGNGG